MRVPDTRLRRSDLLRTASASRLRIAGPVMSSESSGTISTADLSTTPRATAMATLAREQRRVTLLPESPDVQVVDHLFQQIRDVLDELCIALDVTRDSEAHEHVKAEAVGRVDRGGVEVCDRSGQPRIPQRYLCCGTPSEELDQLVCRSASLHGLL